MGLSITNARSTIHCTAEIWRPSNGKCILVFASLMLSWVFVDHSSSTIILWRMIHALIIFSILTLSQLLAGFLTMPKRACKTPKARSTSFRTAYWCWANKTACGPCGIRIGWIIVDLSDKYHRWDSKPYYTDVRWQRKWLSELDHLLCHQKLVNDQEH